MQNVNDLSPENLDTARQMTDLVIFFNAEPKKWGPKITKLINENSVQKKQQVDEMRRRLGMEVKRDDNDDDNIE